MSGHTPWRQINHRASPEQIEAARVALNELLASWEELRRSSGGSRARASTCGASTTSLASVGHGVVLFDTKIKTPAGEYSLDATVTAAVDTAGGIAVKSRSTFTRLGVGTLVAGPIGLVAGAAAKKSKKIDDRELYLLVQSPTWATTVKLNPDLGAAARSFAQQVNLAAANAAAVSAKRKKAVAAAQRKLEAIERDAPATAAAHVPAS